MTICAEVRKYGAVRQRTTTVGAARGKPLDPGKRQNSSNHFCSIKYQKRRALIALFRSNDKTKTI